MEPNAKKRRPSAMQNKAELEKFSRRLIRAVARMLLHEKRNETEVWEGLKKQTGFDCKELWNRMYALTIKKLDRLLEAEDQVDRLPVAARMTITDWLLFDTVIVHQDIDVIGMTATSTEDKKVLVDLFELVEKFRLEFLAGDQLADAWSAATVYYNKENRQCTPMLLQRRWYQLKLATRARFYKFWSVYKGVFKHLSQAEPYRPTPLQTKIATRYKPLVITQFMPWEDLIQNKLVILPEEFEIKGLQKEQAIADDSPDVMCVDPDVETINLDDGSDVELEYRKSPRNDDLATVTVKQEPRDDEMGVDVNTPYQNRQDKIAHCAEAVLKATTIVLEEIDMANDIETFTTSNKEENTTITAGKETILESKNIEDVASTIDGAPLIQVETGLCLTRKDCAIEDQSNTVSVNETRYANIVPINNKDGILTNKAAVENDVEKVSKDPEIVLPQITSVFGGFNDSNENIAKISLITARVTNNVSDVVTQKDPNNVAIESSSNLTCNATESLDSINNVNDDTSSKQLFECNTNSIAQTASSNPDHKSDVTKNMWYSELSNDIDFVDDGIQLLDDGIAYQDEEALYEIDDIKSEINSHIVNVKHEDKIENKEDETNENNSFDEKLLMVPVVYTVKLEDMGILPISSLNHIKDKSLIQSISSKSKVVVKKIDATLDGSENVSSNLKRVKLSSYLLHKPRCRAYNPIQLCKNPDFNTRLKRLSAGFFSSPRNRLLFKTCQPVTIDVTKAFEDRLVNGIMYLNMDGDNLNMEKPVEKIDVKECKENFSVLPSALPAQSLIDNTKGEIAPSIYQPANTKLVEVASLACERKKVINLPDISEVRRINQNLLTAQVTPIQSKNDNAQSSNQATASLVGMNDKDNNVTTSKAGPASRKRTFDTTNEAANTSSSNTFLGMDSNILRNKELWKTGHKIIPWKPRQVRPEVSWINSSYGIYTPDTLLALDALNKMLFILTEGDKDFAVSKSKKKKYKEIHGFGHNLIDKKVPPNDDTDEVQVIGETRVNSLENQNCPQGKTDVSKAPKSRKKIHCCWARGRIHQLKLSRKRTAKHMCPFPLCLCCCKFQLLEFYKSIRGSGKNEEKLSGWVNLLDIEAKHEAEKNNITEKKDVAVDVAELIPINAVTPEPLATNENIPAGILVQKTVEKTDATLSHDKTSSIEIMSCSDKVTVHELPARRDKSVQSNFKIDGDGLMLGAEVSIITSEESSAVSANATNVEKPSATNVPIKKPRIRIDSCSYESPNKKSLGMTHRRLNQKTAVNIESQREVVIPIKDVSGENTNMIHMDVSNINIAKESNQGTVRVRNDLTQVTPKLVNIFKVKKINVTQNDNHSQKMLYLNSNQIAQLPSDNPIHLGKNKILLTNLKFPPNFKAFESYQRNLRQTMALPKGINLILQLNGQLTYTCDCRAIISKEFMAAMPLLISAIQQQIDSTSMMTTETVPPLKPYCDNEIICLSDDETSNITKTENKKESSEKSSIISLSDCQNESTEILESQLENQTNYLKTTKSSDVCNGKERLTSTEIVTATNSESITAANTEENTKNESKTEELIVNSTANPNENLNFELNEQECNSTNIVNVSTQVNKNYFETQDNIQENESIPNNINESKNQSEINSEGAEKLNENNDMHVKVDDCKVNSGKTKNILSDLMAMSGISPTAVAPELTVEATPTDAIIDQLPIQQKASTSLIDTLNSLHNVDTAVHTQTTELQYTLTPITSLSELKYACTHKASFFKLDLNTRLLLPINVCMKNMFEKQRTKPKLSSITETMIDLTNDDVSEQPKRSRKNSLYLFNEPTDNCETSITDTNDIGETINSEHIDQGQDIVASTTKSEVLVENVKPIKLISVAPSILKCRLKKIRDRIIETKKNKNSMNPGSRKRKQNLNYDTTMSCSSPTFGQLSFETSNSDVVDSSSDEETLAVIATRKKQIEKALGDVTSKNEQNDSLIDLPVNEVYNGSDAHDDTVNEITGEADESMNPSEVVMEYLDEALLNEGEQDEEACILGV